MRIPDVRPAWTKIVSELCDHLQENQEKLSLLQEIDKATLSAEASLDQIAEQILHRLSKLAKLSRASFYVLSHSELLPIASTDLASFRVQPSPHLPEHLEAGEIILLASPDLDHGLLEALGCQAILVSPVFGEGQRPLGLLVLETDKPSVLGHLDTPELRGLASAVSRQFSIAINFKERSRSEAIRWQIMAEILDNDLRPGVGFSIIAKHIPNLLPVFRATLLDPSPAVQIILHRGADAHMTIVATTGQEPINTRLLLNRSVCGRLLMENRESINIDPRTDPAYRPYLGHEMRSEFAFRLRLDHRVTAIVNLETPQENAFLDIHTRSLLRGSRHLIPLLRGLYSRRDRTLMQQRALLYALDQHLHGLAATIQHSLSGPLATARTSADLIVSICDNAKVDLGAHASRLISRISELAGITESLAQDVVGFSHNAVRSVRDMLTAARLLTVPDKLQERKVDIEISADNDFDVYCSLLLKEIFHNVMANSVYWIQQRQQDEPDHHGMLEVFLDREKAATQDELDRELNRRVRIVFHDNGPGMSDEDFRNIAERGFTRRKAGSGFALFAAREYVTSLGGEMFFANDAGRSFDVVISLPEYNSLLQSESEPAFGGFSD